MNYNSRLGNSLHKTIGLDKILRQCAITKNSEKFLSKRLFWFYAANTIVIHSLFVHIFLIPTTRYRVAWYEMRDMHTKLGTVPLFAYYPTQVQDSCICVYAVESMRAQLYRIFFRFYFMEKRKNTNSMGHIKQQRNQGGSGGHAPPPCQKNL